jgi:hypothetical protein
LLCDGESADIQLRACEWRLASDVGRGGGDILSGVDDLRRSGLHSGEATAEELFCYAGADEVGVVDLEGTAGDSCGCLLDARLIDWIEIDGRVGAGIESDLLNAAKGSSDRLGAQRRRFDGDVESRELEENWIHVQNYRLSDGQNAGRCIRGRCGRETRRGGAWRRSQRADVGLQIRGCGGGGFARGDIRQYRRGGKRRRGCGPQHILPVAIDVRLGRQECCVEQVVGR